MASIKIGSLLLKTLAKPLASKIKVNAKENGQFRSGTIALAQFLHRSEMKMRVKLLGEKHPAHIRPLNDARAIDAGANFISEGFLFIFAASLILAETTRSRIAEGKRRDLISETLLEHSNLIKEQELRIKENMNAVKEGLLREKELEKIIGEIAEIGIRGGWYESSETWKNREIDAQRRIDFLVNNVEGNNNELSTTPEISSSLVDHQEPQSIAKDSTEVEDEINSRNYT